MIRVLLFAGLQEIAGDSTVMLSMDEDVNSIADVKALLGDTFPAMKALLVNCMAAVNQEYADDATSIKKTDEIAFIPPVSGG